MFINKPTEATRNGKAKEVQIGKRKGKGKVRDLASVVVDIIFRTPAKNPAS